METYAAKNMRKNQEVGKAIIKNISSTKMLSKNRNKRQNIMNVFDMKNVI